MPFDSVALSALVSLGVSPQVMFGGIEVCLLAGEAYHFHRLEARPLDRCHACGAGRTPCPRTTRVERKVRLPAYASFPRCGTRQLSLGARPVSLCRRIHLVRSSLTMAWVDTLRPIGPRRAPSIPFI